MKTKDIKSRILEYFFRHPTERLRVRQIERQANVPLPSAIRYAKELEQGALLKRERIGGVALYSADRTSPKFLLEKRLFNIRALCACGLVEFLARAHDNPPIILFGSYAKGEDVETSDIDLYVETPAKTVRGLELFERRLGRKIHGFFYINIKKVENPDLANSIVNGITLNGFVEVFE